MIQDKLTITLMGPDRILGEGTAHSLLLPASDGELKIFPEHTSLMVALGPGMISWRRREGRKVHWIIEEGLARIHSNDVLIIAFGAEKKK